MNVFSKENKIPKHFKSIPIKTSEVEGEFTLKSVSCMKLNTYKILRAFIMTILTGGLWGILLRASAYLQAYYLYDTCEEAEQATHVILINIDKLLEIRPIIKQEKVIFFEMNYLKYCYHQSSTHKRGYFMALSFLESKSLDPFSIRALARVDQKNQIRYLNLYGLSEINLKNQNIFKYFAIELTQPFLMIQYANSVVWLYNGLILFIIALFSGVFILLVLKYVYRSIAYQKLNEFSKNNIQVKVFRKQDDQVQDQMIESKFMIPGDEFELSQGMKVPADCILLQGKVQMDESMITGESLPIQKLQMPNSDGLFDFSKDKTSFIYQGTKVLDLQHQSCRALALRTGFYSHRGQLIRSIIFAPPLRDSFLKETLLVIGIMIIFMLLVNLPGMIYQEIHNYPFHLRVFLIFSAIFFAVPPALPLYFQCILVVSVLRLRANQIFGLNIQKISQAADIDINCFDKTGTLTTHNMEVHSFIPNGPNFGIQLENNMLQKDTLVSAIMGFCHNIVNLDGQLYGDILEIEMLKFSPFDLDSKEFEKVKTYEFQSQYSIMTVVVKNQQNQFYALSKGSPEKIKSICTKSSLPKNYDNLINSLSMQGYRIIGLASKAIDHDQQTREICEKESQFEGFLIFLNPLKEDTAHSIQILKDNYLDNRIISGDNLLTVINIGKQANIITDEDPLSIMEYDPFLKQIKIHNLLWNELELEIQIQFDKEITYSNQVMKSIKDQIKNYVLKNQNHQLAINGHFFQILELFDKHESPQEQISERLKYLYLSKTKIFGRFLPNQKVMKQIQSEIIQNLQEFGNKVCMIGDGANDCKAIIQANVGISFSQNDASLSAPFSSLNQSISCVEKVFREGRAVKYHQYELILYQMTSCFITSVSLLLLIFYKLRFESSHFILLTFFGKVILMIFIGLTPPSDTLSPVKPKVSPFTAQFFIQLFTINIIYLMQIFTIFYIISSSYDIQGTFQDNILENPLVTNIFLSCWMFDLIKGIMITTWKPYKKIFFNNYLLTFFITVCLTYNVLLFFQIGNFETLNLTYATKSIQLQCFIVTIIFSIFGIIANHSLHFYFIYKQKKTQDLQNIQDRLNIMIPTLRSTNDTQ